MTTRSIRCTSALLGLSLLMISSISQARDYLIEVVIFERLAGRDLNAGGLYLPRIENSLTIGTENAVAEGFLPVEQNLTLNEDAADIAASQRYRMLRHLSWRQPGLADSDAQAVRVSLGSIVPMYLPEDLRPYPEFFPAAIEPTQDKENLINSSIVNGTIKIRLGRFLHMDTRLVFTDQETEQSFRLSQSRKMRSGELHYIDNPRFGILTRITPLEDKALEPDVLEPDVLEPDVDESTESTDIVPES